ncbi:MAG: TIGR02757 family protein [Deltaproteobacteria bacterium]|nr:TIGR02757 family protein [Deltaproteobacteria bacterium]
MGSVRLEVRLNQLRRDQDREARVAADPVSFVHRYLRPDDQEVVGLIAAFLAFGNVTAIRASIDRVLGALGEAPAEAVRRRRRATLERRLEGFVHRIYRGDHVAALLANAGALVRGHGSLGAAFAAELEAAGDFREALADFADALRGPDAPRGLRHLVPDPRAGSACKRLLLYLRWMVRPADGVDLGLWPVSPAKLVIPVDTHVHRIARNLGFTQRKDASWRTAEEITARLRAFDPADPVKYDFALCHLGISRQCPSQRDPDLCATCVLKTHCMHW